MGRKAKEKRGITLIALVVTIVVLLILAGITINMLFSNGGIFKTAQDAANAWNEATVNEQESLNNIADQIGNLVNGQVGGGTDGDEKPTVPEDWDLNKVTPVLSEDNVYVPVPNGFTASTVDGEKTVGGGFVIKQGSDGSATAGINEFVWIPVDETSLGEMYIEVETPVALTGVSTTTSVYSKFRGITEGAPNTTENREPDLVVGNGSEYDTTSNFQRLLGVTSTQDFAQKMVDEYKGIHDSTKQYGGFYIGRYELTGSTIAPTVQKRQVVLTNQNWYNLKAACMKIVDNTGKQESEISAKTTMIYGNQWDEVCDWLSTKGYDINNSSSWGNYKDNTEEGAGTKQNTGYKETWKANNIYDLAGNCREWTQEARYTNLSASRGNCYDHSGSNSSSSASYRNVDFPNGDQGFDLTCRSILYISCTK